jgi:hypothetical protein
MQKKHAASKLKRAIIIASIAFSFLSLVFFGFLLFETVKSYFYSPSKTLNIVKLHMLALFEKSQNKAFEIPGKKSHYGKLSEEKSKKTSAQAVTAENSRAKKLDEKNGKKPKSAPAGTRASVNTQDEYESANTDKSQSPQSEKTPKANSPLTKKAEKENSPHQNYEIANNPQKQYVQKKKKTKPVTLVYKNFSAKSVYLVGSFSSWRPLEMKRNNEGVWEITIYLYSDKYRYYFEADGKQVSDPLTSLKSENYSILAVP